MSDQNEVTPEGFIVNQPTGLNIPPPSAAERELMSEWRDREAVEELTATVKSLAKTTQAEAAEVKGEAKAALEAATETEVLRSGSGPALRAACEKYEADVARANDAHRRQDLTDKMHREALTKAAKDRDAEFARLAEVTDAHAEKLLAAFPGEQIQLPTSGVATDAALAMQRFPLADAATFAREAVTVLERAQDPSVEWGDRARANKLLQEAYWPLCQRRVRNPERFARPYQGVYEELAGAIEQHLSNVLRAPRHRLAKEFVAGVKQNLSFARETAKHQGRWDTLIEQATPFLSWSK